ncbi:MAG: ABC transporter permease [Clostridia bacterium]|nr:ABC transporter permease [Clostridia bacterium]
MRVLSAVEADVRFQIKQGFYAVYVFLTLVYMIVLGQIPDKFHKIVVPIVVFSDPTIVGFFFIGGIVMLEKVQGVLDYVVVTPLRSMEYLAAKVISLSTLAIIAGFALTAMVYKGSVNYFLLIAGVLLSSVFFTLYGFIVAAGCRNINQYLLKSVPYMLFIVLPCFSLLGFEYSWVFSVFPSMAGLNIVYGAFNGVEAASALAQIFYLIMFDIFMFFLVGKIFSEKIVYGG